MADQITPNLDDRTAAVYEYWNTRTMGLQYVSDPSLKVGSRAFFDHIRPAMNPYKFPWIMERIEREAQRLRGKHLLEIGCGMGFDSAEFLKRGVRVTATDLTANAVDLTRKHFAHEGLEAEDVLTASALNLPFPDESFDAVWANGVIHQTGDSAHAIGEVQRVLVPGGRAIISHFYRRNSWMYALKLLGANTEYADADPPEHPFLHDAEVDDLFDGFQILERNWDHHRALPLRRNDSNASLYSLKAAIYTWVFRPAYNLLPESLARSLAYKYSVTAIKR
jgi:SAM-dependent methyltransferase